MPNPAPIHNHRRMPNATLHLLERSSLATMPWSLRAWPPLLWQPGGERAEFRHLGTRVTAGSGGLGRCYCGQTLWAGCLAGGDAGMAWDWVEISRGIVAMADPMSVITNLRILGGEGEVLTSAEAALFLNGIVHRLPWQDEVERALHTQH